MIAAIILWNTVHLEHAISALREHGTAIDHEALAHTHPFRWEHLNLTGDYTRHASGRLRKGSFRPYDPLQPQTRDLIALAHCFDVWVEASFGSIATKSTTDGIATTIAVVL